MVFAIKIQKLQVICKKSGALIQKLDKNSLTYDKIKNRCGLLGHPLERNLIFWDFGNFNLEQFSNQ